MNSCLSCVYLSSVKSVLGVSPEVVYLSSCMICCRLRLCCGVLHILTFLSPSFLTHPPLLSSFSTSPQHTFPPPLIFSPSLLPPSPPLSFPLSPFPSPPLSTHRHSPVPQWFFANYLYALALVYKSVALVNTLSSMSSVFVMILAALPLLHVSPGDQITLSRVLVSLLRYTPCIYMVYMYCTWFCPENVRTRPPETQ